MIRQHLVILLVLCSCFQLNAAEIRSPILVQLGKKLFEEDRFSYSFFKNSQGNYNQKLSTGDPILDEFEILQEMMSGPLKGEQVSCASCHMVNQTQKVQDNFVMTFNDASHRSRVPQRADGELRTVRNSMNMVMSSISPEAPLHWDGEFYSVADLSCATLVGRNMGWLLGEETKARSHIEKVLKNDNGDYKQLGKASSSYSVLFKSLGINLDALEQNEVLKHTCEALEFYISRLDFQRDQDGSYNGSAYDRFLLTNGIRTNLNEGERDWEYLNYLKEQIALKKNWKWPDELPLNYHEEPSNFGPQELQGLKAFLGAAQCASCHRPPFFTDFRFHNTGITQFEYDSVHGRNAFLKVNIPSWSERNLEPALSFVPTEVHPQWEGPYRKVTSKESALFMDLGIWNILGHPDKENIQVNIKKILCESYQQTDCLWSDDEYLEKSVALFKTPTLRSLGQSAPYLHNGSADDILGVLTLYLRGSHFAKKGQLRNIDPFMKAMNIDPGDFRALEAFMRSLNEDYDENTNSNL